MRRALYKEQIVDVIRPGLKNSRVVLDGKQVLVPTVELKEVPKEGKWATTPAQLDQMKIETPTFDPSRKTKEKARRAEHAENWLITAPNVYTYQPEGKKRGLILMGSPEGHKAERKIAISGFASKTEFQTFKSLDEAQKWVEACNE